MTPQKTLVISMFHFKVTRKMVCTRALISCCSQHRYLLLWSP